MNAYVSLREFKASSVAMGLDLEATAGDTRLLNLLEGVSRQADRTANRHFFAEFGTKFFSGDGSRVLITPDLVAVSTLQEDNGGDGVFDTGWAATDYHLAPFNAQPTLIYGRPFNHIQVNRASNGSQDVFLGGQRNYLVSGTWGYVEVTVSAGASASASWSSVATALDVDTREVIETGWTLLVGSEQMYVSAASGSAMTVTRAVNGSTAGTHASGAAVNVYQYPEDVRQAVAIQAGRNFKRSQGQYASDIGFPESGQIVTIRSGMDRDVREFLTPYRRAVMGEP